MKLEFFLQIFKKPGILNFMKILPVVAKMFRTDGWMDRWTDMMKLTVAFCNFVNVPKNYT